MHACEREGGAHTNLMELGVGLGVGGGTRGDRSRATIPLPGCQARTKGGPSVAAVVVAVVVTCARQCPQSQDDLAHSTAGVVRVLIVGRRKHINMKSSPASQNDPHPTSSPEATPDWHGALNPTAGHSWFAHELAPTIYAPVCPELHMTVIPIPIPTVKDRAWRRPGVHLPHRKQQSRVVKPGVHRPRAWRGDRELTLSEMAVRPLTRASSTATPLARV